MRTRLTYAFWEILTYHEACFLISIPSTKDASVRSFISKLFDRICLVSWSNQISSLTSKILSIFNTRIMNLLPLTLRYILWSTIVLWNRKPSQIFKTIVKRFVWGHRETFSICTSYLLYLLIQNPQVGTYSHPKRVPHLEILFHIHLQL